MKGFMNSKMSKRVSSSWRDEGPRPPVPDPRSPAPVRPSMIAGALLCALAGSARARQSSEPGDPRAPRAMSQPSALKTSLEECKSHPSVVQAGTPFEVCVEAYGFVKQDGHWVKKPPTRE